MKCSFPKCVREHIAKGLCRAHYDQLRYGKVLRELRQPVVYPATCTLNGCERPYRSVGYCDMHYQQLRTHGRVVRLAKPATRHARFASAIKLDGEGCWIFGAGERNDYAYFTFEGVSIAAHRYAYQQVVGVIPDGLLIDHKCRRKACVRPTHLRLATTKQNAENQAARRGTITGVRGVTVDGGKYRVHAMHNGKGYYGGKFSDLEEAAKAARDLRARLFTHSNGE